MVVYFQWGIRISILSHVQEMNVKDEASLQTGDILLFRGNSWMSWLVEWFGVSRYSHVGMVIKNPQFMNLDLEDGTYILESSWNNTPDVEDHQMKMGVQLHLLDDVLKEYPKGSVYTRHVRCERNPEFYDTLVKLHKEIHNKPYDTNPWDWLCAKYNMMCPLPSDPAYKTTKRFWCSALVSYLFCELGIIEPNVNWSLVAPREFSSTEAKWVRFRCSIDNEKLIY
jgi:hypothetical protein